MIYKSTNRPDKLNSLIFLPLSAIPFFLTPLFVDATIYSILVGFVLGSFIMLYPVYDFVYRTLEITFEHDVIRIWYPMSQKMISYSYSDLQEIRFTDPPKYSRKCKFHFIRENRKHHVIVEMGDEEAIVELIDHCARKNSSIRFRFSPVRDDLQNWVKMKLVKKTHNIK